MTGASLLKTGSIHSETARCLMARRAVQIAQVLVPGLFAWTVTVLPIVFHGQEWITRISGCSAPLWLISGAIAASLNYNLAGYIVGIWMFLLACTFTWIQGAWLSQLLQFDFWRAASGSIGWALFALGWSTPWRLIRHLENNHLAASSALLKPRQTPSKLPTITSVIAIAGAFFCLIIPWIPTGLKQTEQLATQSSRALFVHGVAVVCAVGMLYTSSTVALSLGKKHSIPRFKQRLAYATPWFFFLIMVASVVVAWMIGSRQ